MDHDFSLYVDEFAQKCNIIMYNAPFIEITCLMGELVQKGHKSIKPPVLFC